MAEPFPKLIVMTGPEEGMNFALPQSGTVFIGRSDENQFALEDSSVSRQHAIITAREGKFFIKDSNSRNGTVLENKKLATGEEVALAHLDEFRLGIYEIRFAEKSFTDAEIRTKKQQSKSSPIKPELAALEKSLTKTPAASIPPTESTKTEDKAPASKPESPDQEKALNKNTAENLQAESLIDDLLEERDQVEKNLPSDNSTFKKIATWMLVIMLVFGLSYAGYQGRKPLLKFGKKYAPAIFGKEAEPTLKNLQNVKPPETDLPPQSIIPVLPVGTESTPLAGQTPLSVAPLSATEAKPSSDNDVTSDNDLASDNEITVTPLPQSLTVMSAGTAESFLSTATFSVFLDVTSEPLPATIYFNDVRLGLAPLKNRVSVEANKVYDLYADYELRDINDIYRKKVQFKAMPNSDVIELAINAEIGVLKIMRLPPRTEFYLEGYYDYDKLKANPVKLNDIIYGQPIYLPYGKYVVELREQLSVSGSENLITQIRYQREFHVDKDNPLTELNVTDKDLKYFPAVIKSNPSNAEVFYNGEKVGKTPFKGNLPIGAGQLKIAKDGFFDKTLDLDMRMNSVYETTIDLETSKVGELLNKAKDQIRNEQSAQSIDTLVEALKYGGSAKEKSEVYYMLGEGYFAQKQYALAEPYYQKAKAEADFNLRASLGLAKVYNEQKNSDLALKTVIEVLANIDANTPPSVRGEANAVFKKISPIKSVIMVFSDPPEADVYLNDKKLDQKTPLLLSDLGLGNYRIEIEKAGYKTYNTKQTLKLGEFAMIKARLEKESF